MRNTLIRPQGMLIMAFTQHTLHQPWMSYSRHKLARVCVCVCVCVCVRVCVWIMLFGALS